MISPKITLHALKPDGFWLARIISDVTGANIIAEKKPLDEFREAAENAGMPIDRIEQLCSMNSHYDKHGLIGNSNVLEWILERRPTDFKTFIQDNFLKH